MNWSLNIPEDAIVSVNRLSEERFQDMEVVAVVQYRTLTLTVNWDERAMKFIMHGGIGEGQGSWSCCSVSIPTKPGVKAMIANYIRSYDRRNRKLIAFCHGEDRLKLCELLTDFITKQENPCEPKDVLTKFKQTVARTLNKLDIRHEE